MLSLISSILAYAKDEVQHRLCISICHLLPSLLCCFSAQQALCTLLSRQAKEISCLQEEQDEFDRERQALRSYIIKRCSKAVALMYGDLQAQQVCSLAITVWD